jgi:sortase A
MSKTKALIWLGGALMLGGAAFLSIYSYDSLRRAHAEKSAKEWLKSPAQPVARPVRHGDVLGELDIPRLHMSVPVYEGDDARILKVSAGHIPGTALRPGSGNIGIAAHRDTLFRPLRLIRPDDLITLRTPSGTSRFSVTKTEIVKPSNVEVLASVPGRDLTLVTCYPFSYIGHAPERFIVYATRHN